MTKEQIANNKAELDYNVAEQLAEKRGLIDAEKWMFICGYLQEKLSIAYGETQ